METTLKEASQKGSSRRGAGGYCNNSGVKGWRYELWKWWCRMGWRWLFLVRSCSLGPTAPWNSCCGSGLLTAHSPIFSGHLGHMEVFVLKVKSELQVPAYSTGTGIPIKAAIETKIAAYISQLQNTDPLRKARDWPCILRDIMSGLYPTELEWELRRSSNF